MKVGDGTPGPGRPKGSPNKSTLSIKKAFAEAFEKMGGAKALQTWGVANPTEFYRLASKLIPTEISGPNGGPIQTDNSTTVSVEGLDDSQLKALASIPVHRG